jgi:pfkB family carbohydrate kinase
MLKGPPAKRTGDVFHHLAGPERPDDLTDDLTVVLGHGVPPALVMSRLRLSPTPTVPPSTRPLRVVAAGTLFLTHTLSLPSHPGPAQTIRAHEYVRSRGGSAPAVLSVLSQLHAEKCWLVASLGSSQEARSFADELRAEGVSTRYCKVWEGAGVPAAWVLHAGELYARESRGGKLTYVSRLQLIQVPSLLSTIIRSLTFHMRNLSRFWDHCLSPSTTLLRKCP